MEKLKTLKDLEKFYRLGYETIKTDELKAEAVKWVKWLMEHSEKWKKEDNKEPWTRGYNQGFESSLNYFISFLDLTEDDLK